MDRFTHRFSTVDLTRIAAVIVVAMGLYALVTGWQSYANPQVVVEWSTATELDTAGFNLYRSMAEDGPFEQANDLLIPSSPDPLTGGDYEFVDQNVAPGVTYFYQLEEVEYNGATQRFDPIQVDAGGSLLSVFLAGITVLAGIVLFWASPKRTSSNQTSPNKINGSKD